MGTLLCVASMPPVDDPDTVIDEGDFQVTLASPLRLTTELVQRLAHASGDDQRGTRPLRGGFDGHLAGRGCALVPGHHTDLFHAGEAWVAERRPMAVEAVQKRLSALEQWLGGRDYLEDRFTAGDLLMTTVLRILRHTDIVSGRPTLRAYQDRCEARPAFQKAMADHLKPYKASAA